MMFVLIKIKRKQMAYSGNKGILEGIEIRIPSFDNLTPSFFFFAGFRFGILVFVFEEFFFLVLRFFVFNH
jgi:hypothetical protein